MISCTDFIAAYSQLFKTLEKHGGSVAVEEFWHYLAANYLHNLRGQVIAHGIYGCWLYWQHTLSEEAADFTMEIDSEAGEFSIDMDHCPSKGRLLQWRHLEPYHDYCRHCDILYRDVLEPLGYDYQIDLSQADQARCRIVVTRKPGKTEPTNEPG